jgi:hypothetical protein
MKYVHSNDTGPGPGVLGMLGALLTMGFMGAGVLPRAEALGWIPSYVLTFVLWTQAIFGVVVLLRWSTRIAVFVLLLFSAVLLHSFCNIYTPSLRIGIPIQDYLLHDLVSANYSFNMAKLYLSNLFFFAPASLAIGLYWRRLSSASTAIFVLGIAVTILANISVIFWQGFTDLNFLAAGSGTAVAAHRAAGLLEDSGASTVYMGAIMAMLWAVAIATVNLAGISRILIYGILILGVVSTHYTDGRIFYVSFLGSVALISAGVAYRFVNSRATRFSWSKLAVGLALGGMGVAGTLYLGRDRLNSMYQKFADAKLDENIGPIWGILKVTDQARTSSYYTTYLTWLDHQNFGSGLGSYHAQNFIYASRLLNDLGLTPLVDNPANMYLTVLAALGMAGILLWIAYGQIIFRLVRASFAAKAREWTPGEGSVLVGALAILLAISVSFMAGIHLIFVSFGSLFMVPFIACGILASHRIKDRKLFSRIGLASGLAIIILLGRSAYLAATAAPIPEFQWAELGKAQIPLPLRVPISPRENTGYWASNPAEILYDGSVVKVFVEMPKENYPLQVHTNLFDQSGKEAWSQTDAVDDYTLPDPSRVYSFEPGEEFKSKCANPTPVSYCYLRISLSPRWIWEGQVIGPFIIK